MANFLDILKQSRQTPIAIRFRFIQEYKQQTANVYAFFESTDDFLFYGNEISRFMHTGGILHVYYCENKNGVYHHYEFAETTGRLDNVICFVDKDLDDLVGSVYPVKPRIFVTDFYSIETYLCAESIVRRALEEVIMVEDENGLHNSIIAEFSKEKSNLESQLRPMFAMAICSRRQGGDADFSQLGDSLNQIIDLDGICPVAKLNAIGIFAKKCGLLAIAAPDLVATEVELSGLDPNTWVRGKFHIWFLINFIERTWESLVGSPVTGRKKVKKQYSINSANIFNFFGRYSEKPANLDAFLQASIATV